jgi:hypothetical protein
MHRVKPDHVSLRIEGKCDETVFADGHLLFVNCTTILISTRCFHSAVFARKVNDGSSNA